MPSNLQTTLSFLEDLRFNNNRDWFNANRKQYDAARAAFESLVGEILTRFSPIENIGETTVKQCIFRINRDIRFSKYKSPYKVNMGALIGNGGRKSAGRTYYLNIEPGESFIAGGVYDPSPDQLKRIRQAIADNADELRSIINHPDFVRYFGGLRGDALKTAPKGYAGDHPAIDLLKRKQFLALHELNDADVLRDDFVDHVITVCAALKPLENYFHDLLS